MMSLNSTTGIFCSFSKFTVPFMVLTVSHTVWIGIMGIFSTVLYISKQFPRQIRLLLLNLSALDITTSLLTVLLDFQLYLSSARQPLSLKLQIFLIEIRVTAHMLSITFMTLDRIMSLVFAMQYQIKVTDIKTYFVCFTVWVFTFATVGGALYDVFSADHDVVNISALRNDRYYIIVGTKAFLLISSIGGCFVMCVYLKSTRYLAGHTVPSFQTKSTKRLLHSALLHSILYSLDLAGSIYAIQTCTCILRMIFIYRILVHLSYFASVLMLTVQSCECRLLFAIVLCSCHRGWTEHLNRVRNELYAPYLKNAGQETSNDNMCDVRDVDGLDFSITEISTKVDMIPLPSIHEDDVQNSESPNYSGNVY